MIEDATEDYRFDVELDGFAADPRPASARMAAEFEIDIDIALAIVNAAPLVVRSGLKESEANELEERIRKIGGEAEIKYSLLDAPPRYGQTSKGRSVPLTLPLRWEQRAPVTSTHPPPTDVPSLRGVYSSPPEQNWAPLVIALAALLLLGVAAAFVFTLL